MFLRKSAFQRLIAGVVAIVFALTTTAGWAEPLSVGADLRAEPTVRHRYTKRPIGARSSGVGPFVRTKISGGHIGPPLHLPPEFGTIRRLFLADKDSSFPRKRESREPVDPRLRGDDIPGRLVVFIQDAHAHLEAQKNIQKIVEHFGKYLDIQTILAEGAAGEADISKLRSFPEKDAAREVADRFLSEAKLTGLEYAAITSEANYRIVGIENAGLYDQHFRAFLSNERVCKENEAALGKLFEDLERKKKKTFNRELYELDRTMVGAESKETKGRPPKRVWWAGPPPAEMGEREKGREGERFFAPSPILLLARRARELGVDFDHLQQIRIFLRMHVLESLLNLPWMGSGKHDHARYEKRLNELKSELDFEAFVAEQDELFAAVKEKLFQNDEERKLDRTSRFLQLTAKLVRLQMTPREWEEWKRTGGRGPGSESRAPSPGPRRAVHVAPAETFYRLATRRDRALSKNALRELAQTNRAFLITGGFHGHALESVLKENGISFITVIPHIGAEFDNRRYLNRMLSDGAIHNPVAGAAPCGDCFAVDRAPTEFSQHTLNPRLLVFDSGFQQEFLDAGEELVWERRRGGGEPAKRREGEWAKGRNGEGAKRREGERFFAHSPSRRFARSFPVSAFVSLPLAGFGAHHRRGKKITLYPERIKSDPVALAGHFKVFNVSKYLTYVKEHISHSINRKHGKDADEMWLNEVAASYIVGEVEDMWRSMKWIPFSREKMILLEVFRDTLDTLRKTVRDKFGIEDPQLSESLVKTRRAIKDKTDLYKQQIYVATQHDIEVALKNMERAVQVIDFGANPDWRKIARLSQSVFLRMKRMKGEMGNWKIANVRDELDRVLSDAGIVHFDVYTILNTLVNQAVLPVHLARASNLGHGQRGFGARSGMSKKAIEKWDAKARRLIAEIQSAEDKVSFNRAFEAFLAHADRVIRGAINKYGSGRLRKQDRESLIIRIMRERIRQLSNRAVRETFLALVGSYPAAHAKLRPLHPETLPDAIRVFREDLLRRPKLGNRRGAGFGQSGGRLNHSALRRSVYRQLKAGQKERRKFVRHNAQNILKGFPARLLDSTAVRFGSVEGLIQAVDFSIQPKYFTGEQYPNSELIKKLAGAHGVTVDTLLGTGAFRTKSRFKLGILRRSASPADRIRDLRVFYRLSQTGLAAISGLRRTTVSLVEEGQMSFHLETAVRMALALRVSPGQLIESSSRSRRGFYSPAAVESAARFWTADGRSSVANEGRGSHPFGMRHNIPPSGFGNSHEAAEASKRRQQELLKRIGSSRADIRGEALAEFTESIRPLVGGAVNEFGRDLRDRLGFKKVVDEILPFVALDVAKDFDPSRASLTTWVYSKAHGRISHLREKTLAQKRRGVTVSMDSSLGGSDDSSTRSRLIAEEDVRKHLDLQAPRKSKSSDGVKAETVKFLLRYADDDQEKLFLVMNALASRDAQSARRITAFRLLFGLDEKTLGNLHGVEEASPILFERGLARSNKSQRKHVTHQRISQLAKTGLELLFIALAGGAEEAAQILVDPELKNLPEPMARLRGRLMAKAMGRQNRAPLAEEPDARAREMDALVKRIKDSLPSSMAFGSARILRLAKDRSTSVDELLGTQEYKKAALPDAWGKMSLAERLHYLRTSLALSQQELSRMAGLGMSTIQYLEGKNNPTYLQFKTYLRLAFALGVSPGQLLEDLPPSGFGTGAWEESSLRDWIVQNVSDGQAIADGEVFKSHVASIVAILNNSDLSGTKKKPLLKNQLKALQVSDAGRLADTVIKAEPPLHIDPRIAVPVPSTNVFLLPTKEMFFSFTMRPDLSEDRSLEDVLTEEGVGSFLELVSKVLEDIPAAGAAMRADWDPKFVYRNLLLIAKENGFVELRWLEDNREMLIGQLQQVVKKGNVLISLSAAKEMNDDELHDLLAHEFFHVELDNWWVSFRRNGGRSNIEKLQRFLRLNQDSVSIILREAGDYDLMNFERYNMFDRFSELITQIMFPGGRFTIRMKVRGYFERTRDKVFEWFPEIRRLRENALEKANQALPKIRQAAKRGFGTSVKAITSEIIFPDAEQAIRDGEITANGILDAARENPDARIHLIFPQMESWEHAAGFIEAGFGAKAREIFPLVTIHTAETIRRTTGLAPSANPERLSQAMVSRLSARADGNTVVVEDVGADLRVRPIDRAQTLTGRHRLTERRSGAWYSGTAGWPSGGRPLDLPVPGGRPGERSVRHIGRPLQLLIAQQPGRVHGRLLSNAAFLARFSGEAIDQAVERGLKRVDENRWQDVFTNSATADVADQMIRAKTFDIAA